LKKTEAELRRVASSLSLKETYGTFFDVLVSKTPFIGRPIEVNSTYLSIYEMYDKRYA